MARLRVIEDDQRALSANPWEEELREREAEDEENEKVDEEVDDYREKEEEEEEEEGEEQKQQQANQPILPPKRNIPGTPTMPKTQSQKGLEPIFVKVDHQIALLDNQISHIRIELLQTRRLVTAVKSTVSKVNQPEVSKRLEEDAFSNYLRIGDKLKRLAKDIVMIVPDQPRQANVADKVYKEPVHTDLSEKSASGATVLDSRVCEPSISIHRRDESVSAIDVSALYTGSHDYRNPYDEWARLPFPDELKPSGSVSWPRTSPQPRSSKPTNGSSPGRRHSTKIHNIIPNRERFPSPRRWSVYNTNEFYPRLPRQRRFSKRSKYRSPPTGRGSEEPIARSIHRTHYDPISDGGSSTYPGSIICNSLTDSSDFEDFPYGPYRIKKKNVTSRRNSVGYTQRNRDLRASTTLASRRTGKRESYSGQRFIVPEQRSSPVTEQREMPPDGPRIVERLPNSVQGLEIRNFLLEEPHDLQERIQALQSGQTGKNLEENGNRTESSISSIKGNFWSRLKSKFIHQNGHTEKKRHWRDTAK
ncbi:hypothetical protein N7509_012678 [Penicillium cosmopolitanum]|uniref:Uncharacterized protein n=1 Tax=Penicillium cosmopolitanum TaxID=1131564 RepID=A0A9W9SKT5_9EURO|nr:uncharacterized protein N7509_012678 [Penicillium cosmopolitanum]KAJ5379559.1 hypothetical protein N7509_012678 [Penicillium cosmopolitanum]